MSAGVLIKGIASGSTVLPVPAVENWPHLTTWHSSSQLTSSAYIEAFHVGWRVSSDGGVIVVNLGSGWLKETQCFFCDSGWLVTILAIWKSHDCTILYPASKQPSANEKAIATFTQRKVDSLYSTCLSGALIILDTHSRNRESITDCRDHEESKTGETNNLHKQTN